MLSPPTVLFPSLIMSNISIMSIGVYTTGSSWHMSASDVGLTTRRSSLSTLLTPKRNGAAVGKANSTTSIHLYERLNLQHTCACPCHVRDGMNSSLPQAGRGSRQHGNQIINQLETLVVSNWHTHSCGNRRPRRACETAMTEECHPTQQPLNEAIPSYDL